jgi:multicomponent Na+:H+ antiporter subunit C
VNSFLIYALSAILLVGIGLYGVIAHSHLLRKIIALNVMSSGVFMLFIALARRAPEAPDPVPHAMVITGIVVAVSATAVALALLLRMTAATANTDLPEQSGEGG